MSKITLSLLAISLLYFQTEYYGSTTAPVVIAGGIIKAKHVHEAETKYRRKDCPVCKGKGWYMSGDDIKKIECNYCEPEKGAMPGSQTNQYQNCPNGKCQVPSLRTK
jgi:hypothetical protein